jgi:hypothetical protein
MCGRTRRRLRIETPAKTRDGVTEEERTVIRMLRKAQIDSSDGAAVRAWIEEYTAYMRAAAPSGIDVSAWRVAYGPYGVAYWCFDAPDIQSLDVFMDELAGQAGYGDILKRGSTLFLSGATSDMVLKRTG